MKNQKRNLFLPLNHQLAEYMKMHDQKVKEYENYLNYLNFTMINNSRNGPNKAFPVPPPPTPVTLPPPPTPVTLAFSHLASPTTNPFCHINQDYFVNNFQEPFESIYTGEEANIWGPGKLGLFAKTPTQLEELSNISHPSLEHKSTESMTKNKLNPIQISDAARLQAWSISSPKSSMPPGFQYKCSPSAEISMRDEMFMVNRSM